ncbi:MAG TPA: universal stress protein [Flavobacteriales bacterium]|nr:universal stress protein [Flavobacteriales bacterium]
MMNIALPTDLSETSFKAATFAFDLYGTAGTKYTLVHAYLKPAFDNALLPRIGNSTQREAVNGLRRFERRCRQYADRAVIAKRTSHFSLVDVLNELDRNKGVDMIVMGTQGAGNYGLVGSNTKAVVLGASAPVITVPSQWAPAPVKRIMLADDGGSLDRFTLEPLVALARRTGAEVVLAHVRENTVSFDKHADRAQVAELLSGIRHSFVTVQGDEVSREIDGLARQGGVQLVAVIHRQRGFWEAMFHGSKAKRMALHTTVPLLVLPERP